MRRGAERNGITIQHFTAFTLASVYNIYYTVRSSRFDKLSEF